MLLQVIDKQDLARVDPGPFDGLLKDLDCGFFESHLMGQDPPVKDVNDRKFREDVFEMKGIGV